MKIGQSWSHGRRNGNRAGQRGVRGYGARHRNVSTERDVWLGFSFSPSFLSLLHHRSSLMGQLDAAFCRFLLTIAFYWATASSTIPG